MRVPIPHVVTIVLVASMMLPACGGARRDDSPRVEGRGASSGPTTAGVEKWEKLGEKRVRFGTDRDIIPVTIREGLFRHICLEVSENGIEVLNLKVVYGNGEHDDIPVRAFIAEGGRTRVINLEGTVRVIRHVELVYRTRGPVREGWAHVTLYGR